jgi:hypothetical protein
MKILISCIEFCLKNCSLGWGPLPWHAVLGGLIEYGSIKRRLVPEALIDQVFIP